MSDLEGALAKFFHDRGRMAYRATEHCFIAGCGAKPINAHSITNSRLLRKIADNGEVIHKTTEEMDPGGMLKLVPTGRRKATAFPGFCDAHDKIFTPIDNQDYVPGDREMEFLFAMRAAAKEYTTRTALDHMHVGMLEELRHGGVEGLPEVSDEAIEGMEDFYVGFSQGTRDIAAERDFFNSTFERRRFWKIRTETVVIDGEYPLVAASMFKLESGPDGSQINDIADLTNRQWPMYLTVFPQAGKTYALLSWHHSHDRYYSSVVGVSQWSEKRKRVAISNLVTSYVENFAANPTYWSSLPASTMRRFDQYFGATGRMRHVPFLLDESYSLLDPATLAACSS